MPARRDGARKSCFIRSVVMNLLGDRRSARAQMPWERGASSRIVAAL